MVFQNYYNKLVQKDFILKDVSVNYQEVPEITKLELVIYYPKISDNYEKMFLGIFYLEELSGQFPSLKLLSSKRTGASEYESNYLIKSSLRDENLYNFLYFLH